MPVPRGSLFGVPDENFPRGDPNKKHIKWDDENLRQNELTKTAKDIIDEPDTPWASPPPELFDSEEEIEEEEKNRRKISEEEIKQRLEGLEMEGGREEEEEEEERDGTTTTTTTTTNANARRSTGVQFVAASGGDCFSKEGEEENGNVKSKDALLFDDTMLKSRLFEAQRKSLQCTYDRKKGTTFNKTAHPYARDDNREKYDDDDDDKDDKDEEEIKRELEALLNMQKSSS